MFLFKKGQSFSTCKPGEWVLDEQGMVWIRCPHEHGHPAVIAGRADPAKDWKIDAHGRVTPSVFYQMPDCSFHEFIQLEGWVPPPSSPAPDAAPAPAAPPSSSS